MKPFLFPEISYHQWAMVKGKREIVKRETANVKLEHIFQSQNSKIPQSQNPNVLSPPCITFAGYFMLYQTKNIVQSLPVMEAFYSLQGEGFHQGRAAYFIRLGGCDVGCFWCDVKESWNASAHPRLRIEDVVKEAAKQPARLAVVTGGEPLLHNLDELTERLHVAGFETNIETSGSSPLSGNWDWICLSPKKFKAPLPQILPLANELKVVIFNKHDFAWAEKYAAQVNPSCRLYLQPEWSKAIAVTPLIIDYIMEHPKWQLGLQVHKYINVR